MEATNAYFMTLGASMLLLSWILLLITSWREDYGWGLFTVLLPPLSYLYALTRLDKAGAAVLSAVVGWFMIYLAF